MRREGRGPPGARCPGSNVFLCGAELQIPELEVDRFVRIFSRWRRSYENVTTALGATGRGLLAAAARVSEDAAKGWLKGQAIWQIYLPPSKVHSTSKIWRDVRCRTKSTRPTCSSCPKTGLAARRTNMRSPSLTQPLAIKRQSPWPRRRPKRVPAALEKISRRSSLRWPKLLQVDPGREFMGAVNQMLAKHGVQVRRGPR